MASTNSWDSPCPRSPIAPKTDLLLHRCSSGSFLKLWEPKDYAQHLFLYPCLGIDDADLQWHLTDLLKILPDQMCFGPSPVVLLSKALSVGGQGVQNNADL